MSHRRLPFLLLFAACAGLMGFAFYLEYVQGLEPCPLCMIQRLILIAIGAVALLGALHGPLGIGRRVYGGLLLLLAVLGGAVAARHVWLQHLPADQVPECGPGLDYLMSTFPLMDVLQEVLGGSGECAEVSWTFLSLSIPEWTLVTFAGVLAFSVWVIVTGPPRPRIFG